MRAWDPGHKQLRPGGILHCRRCEKLSFSCWVIPGNPGALASYPGHRWPGLCLSVKSVLSESQVIRLSATQWQSEVDRGRRGLLQVPFGQDTLGQVDSQPAR